MTLDPLEIIRRPIQAHEKDWAKGVVQTVMRTHVETLWGWDQAFQDRYFEEKTWTRYFTEIEVIEAAGEPAGWLRLEFKDVSIALSSLYLSSQHQGQGIGAALLDMVKRQALSAQLPLELSVLSPNTRALAFYRREGFKVAKHSDERIFMRWSNPST